MGVYKNDNGTLELISGATLWADAPIGCIQAYGGATAPDGWLICNGAAVSRTTYAALFAVVGTSFGAGDGSTTFNVPDLREATVKGAGLTGLSNNHMDADGLAVGEFTDDRIQQMTGEFEWRTAGDNNLCDIVSNKSNVTGVFKKNVNSGQYYVIATSGGKYADGGNLVFDASNVARTGATTEVKSVGVNYIIKAQQVAVPADFAGAAEAAGTAAAEEVVALKQNITDNSLNTISKTVPGAINEVAGHAKLIGGDADYTWIDIPADKSTSGKMTRAFIHDQDLFMGAQIWTNGSLTREGKFFFRPTPTQITFLNGVTTAEPANCNIIDFGAFIVVNLANVTIPSDFAQFNYFMQLPAFATARINFIVPTAAGYEVVYIDANTRELRITNKVTNQIFTNMIIPVGPARY